MILFKGKKRKEIGRLSQKEELRLGNAVLKAEKPIDPFLQDEIQGH